MAGQGAEYCPIPSVLVATDAARTGRQRLRVESTNLLVLGAAASAIGLGWMFGGSLPFVSGLLIPIAFVGLAVLMSHRSNRIGMRGRQIGYTSVAVVSVVAIPWVLTAATVFGALSLLGAGFVVFGWRERCQRLWVTGALGSLLGLITASEPIRTMLSVNAAEGSVATGVVTASFGVIAFALGVLSYLAESEGLARIG
ncbi:hypothetical protein ABI214_06375 [Prescottella soli]|uniref:DUF308 domain-containing protein n=1 Tax=Prescottella soli TaxID=1543852 RepID=A0ABW9FPL9_9NOCA